MSEKKDKPNSKSGLSNAESQSLKAAIQKAKEKAKKDTKKKDFKEVL